MIEKVGGLGRLGKPLVGDPVKVTMASMVNGAKGAPVPPLEIVIYFIDKVEFF